MSIPTPNYFVLIPSHILDDPRVDDSTALLFGRISSLSNSYGYCFASDKYLAELTGVTDREIKKRLKVLDDCGYIKRETKKNGMFWDRKIFPNYNYEGITRSPRREHMVPSEGIICSPEQDKREINKKEKKKREKEKSADASPPPKSKAKKPPPDPDPQKELIQHGSYVKLTKEEYDEFCEVEGKQETDEMIEDMNDYCEASRPKGYANYKSALRKWFRKEKKDARQKKKDRKFAPCSDDKKAYEALKEMDKYAL